MKAYVHDTKTKGLIEKICIDAGIEILTPQDIQRRKRLPEHIDSFLDDVDILIIEVTKPTQTVHFILAQAILTEKPTLCLYAKNQTPRELLSYIKKKTAPRPIKTFSYIDSMLPACVVQFIHSHDETYTDNDDEPFIKFTLRLTPRIERYLERKSKKESISKADYIRNLLKELAQKDEEDAG